MPQVPLTTHWSRLSIGSLIGNASGTVMVLRSFEAE